MNKQFGRTIAAGGVHRTEMHIRARPQDRIRPSVSWRRCIVRLCCRSRPAAAEVMCELAATKNAGRGGDALLSEFLKLPENN